MRASAAALAYEAVVAALPTTPVWTAASLRDEGRRDYPPAPPPGCTLVGTVRDVTVPGSSATAFVTAANAARSMLSIAATMTTVPSESDGDDASAASTADSATWIAEATGSVRWLRGPIEPGSTSVVAGATADSFVVAWALPGSNERADGSIRIASLTGLAPPRIETLATQLEPAVSDLACTAAACTLAYGWGDRYAPSETADRTAWSVIWPSHTNQPPERIVAPDGYRPSNAIAPADGGFVGTASLARALSVFERRPPHVAHALDAIVLDVARIGTTVRAVVARAPATDRCQPGAWHVELMTIHDDGSLGTTVDLATTDARPRGARVRPLGSGGEPLVTWLDAPQCAERFFVVRAWRNGQVAAVASAEEYDVATDGADEVSLALRHGDSIRWIRARCPP